MTLKDTAALSGGYDETGTITFTLYDGGKLVDTETVTVSGNGSYTTPTGYTLPTTGTVTGTYQWDASYSGDANNNAVSGQQRRAEQVMVSAASPTIDDDPQSRPCTLGTHGADADRLGGRWRAATTRPARSAFTLKMGTTRWTPTASRSAATALTRPATRCPPRARWRAPTRGRQLRRRRQQQRCR